jgi:hypothetical protein
MIEYKANYEVGNRPYICKAFTASNGEEIHTALHFANEDERKEFSAELIYEHLGNVIKYIQDTAKDLSMIALDEPVGSNPWAIKGWEKLEWANAEAHLWWNDVYYRPESPVNNQPNQVVYISGDDHVHTEEADHTHDPETGEEIPNA